MSDVFYPIGNIESLKVDLITRTISDTFEDGSSSSRRLWSPQNFKRRFTLKHAPLSQTEFRFLRSFFSARDGEYDSFWFRDNVHRGGNAKVRLGSPFKISKSGANVYDTEVILQEVAPIRLLPEFDEVLTQALGGFFWYDPNRYKVYQHQFERVFEDTIYDSMEYQPGFGQTVNLTLANDVYCLLPFFYEQYPAFYATSGNTNYGLSNVTFNNLNGHATKPNFSLGLFVKAGTSSARQVILHTGAPGAGKGIGLQLTGANNFAPFIGGSESWTGCVQSNAASDTWRSIVVASAAGSDTVYMYVNGVLVGSGANTRSWVPGKVSLFADASGGNICSNLQLGNVVMSPFGYDSLLTQGFATQFHNLFAYQYGLPTI